jgi:hypothetical protein
VRLGTVVSAAFGLGTVVSAAFAFGTVVSAVFAFGTVVSADFVAGGLVVVLVFGASAQRSFPLVRLHTSAVPLAVFPAAPTFVQAVPTRPTGVLDAASAPGPSAAPTAKTVTLMAPRKNERGREDVVMSMTVRLVDALGT